MKNLLPAPERSLVSQQYYLRLVVVVLVFAFALGVVWVLALLPSYLLVQAQKKALTLELAQVEEQIERGGGNEARKFLADTAILVERAYTAEEMPRTLPLLSAIRATTTAGIVPTNVSLVVQSATSARATVQGKASTRTQLVAYSDLLEADERVSAVTLPLRDLAANQDILFTLTIDFAL